MPRNPKQAKLSDFRDRMRKVAVEMFAERGPDGFNMRDLAKRLSVSAMTPYRYFENKAEILASVRAHGFASLADRLEAACAVPGSLDEKHAALSHAYVQFAFQEQFYYRFMFELSPSQIPTTPEVQTQELRVRAALAEYARVLVDAGLFTGDPELIGRTAWSALHGAMALRLGGQIDDDDFSDVLSETTRTLAAACSAARDPVSVKA